MTNKKKARKTKQNKNGPTKFLPFFFPPKNKNEKKIDKNEKNGVGRKKEDLVGSADEIEVVLGEEVPDDVLSEGEGNPSIVLTPSDDVSIGVGPKQVAHQACCLVPRTERERERDRERAKRYDRDLLSIYSSLNAS